jgi:lambda repressor-like predicted transcriptional regulator
MDTETIKYELKLRGYTLKRLAQEIGVCLMTVQREIHKFPNSERVRRAIANKIEQKPEDVFPEYYNSPRAKYSPARTKACC